MPPLMIYRFTFSDDAPARKIKIHSDAELIFVYEFFAVSNLPSLEIETARLPVDFLVNSFALAGLKTNISGNILHIERTEVPCSMLAVDFSAQPLLAIPFAVGCAAASIQADLKGLQPINTMIPVFQRLLYKVNIATDFCDGSKLKIFNRKQMLPAGMPFKIADDYLSLCLIPLAVRFGKIELDLDKKFFEKYPWLLSSVLAAVRISFTQQQH